MSKLRGTFTVMAAGLLALGGLTASAAAASASSSSSQVSCYGDYCSGQQPDTTGCANDAVTLYSVQLPDGAGRLDLRWSERCRTNWARWQQYPTGWCFDCAPLALVAVQNTGYTQELDWFDHGTSPEPGTYWTPMIYSPVHTVWAGVHMPCGDDTLLGAAVDCALNYLVRTPAY